MSPEKQSSNGPEVPAVQPFLYVSANGEDCSLSGADGTIPGQEGDGSSGSGQQGQTAYSKGAADGEARARAVFEKQVAELRGQISEALRQFTQQREVYFKRVEAEVVQLSLSISKKILHRESQIDPLLLAGVVHVALEKLDSGVRVRLRTNPDEIRFWREYFGRTTEIHPSPELSGDPALGPGHCVLETDLGSTHISFDTQLKEIEQGFLDLLEQRPRDKE